MNSCFQHSLCTCSIFFSFFQWEQIFLQYFLYSRCFAKEVCIVLLSSLNFRTQKMVCPNVINGIWRLRNNYIFFFHRRGQEYFYPWQSPDVHFTLYIPLYLQAILFKLCLRSICDSFFKKSYLFSKTALKNTALG